jgi:hypothetical protein
MSMELSRPRYVDPAFQTALEKVEKYSGDRRAVAVAKEGARHVVAEQMQAAKTIAAIKLASEIHGHAFHTAVDFTLDVHATMRADGYDDESRNAIAAIGRSATAQFSQHVRAITDLGVMAVSREVPREVLVEEEKRGWFR